MIHGFPDFWYTWRKQMDALSGHYRLVAVDQRGYDLIRPAERRRELRDAVAG